MKNYREIFELEGPLATYDDGDGQEIDMAGMDLYYYIQSALLGKPPYPDHMKYPGTYRITLERVGEIHQRWVRHTDPDDQAKTFEELPECCQKVEHKTFEFECDECNSWWLEMDGKVEE